MYDLYRLLHLVAAILWMGGMAFMLLALRPAAATVLPPPERVPLMAAVMRRFFALVAGSIAVLLASGGLMVASQMHAAGSGAGLPLGWRLMMGIGVLMVLVFGHLVFAGHARFQRAAAARDWPQAGKAATQIQRLVVANFVLGWVAIAGVRLLH